MTVMFTGGTDLAVLANRLADDLAVGSWLVPARAWFRQEDDAEAFETLLQERGVKYAREPARKDAR